MNIWTAVIILGAVIVAFMIGVWYERKMEEGWIYFCPKIGCPYMTEHHNKGELIKLAKTHKETCAYVEPRH